MAATITLTNQEFLEAIAGDDWRRVPISWGENSWWVRPAGKNIAKPTIESSNYFTVSLFKPAGDGKFARKKELFERQFVFVIDDVGTKLLEAEVRAVMPPATYELETSPGNWQYGYKLTNATDARALDALICAIVDDPDINPSLKDPGMKGVTRVARLPVGSNNKDSVKAKNGGAGWPHRMAVWEPSRAYSIEDLAFWLGVDLGEDALLKFKGVAGTRNATQIEADADYVLRFLDTRGMVLDDRPNDNGFISIVCPWAEEHSDSRNEAGYKPGMGGFQCHHGHCESRGMPDLKAWVAKNARPGEQAAALAETFGDVPEDDPLLLAEIEIAQTRHDATVKERAMKIEDTLAAIERPETAPMVEYSEDWLTAIFVNQFAHTLRYVPAWGRWRVYDGACWRDDDKLATYDAARKVCRAAASAAETKTEMKRLASAKTRAAVVSMAQSDPRLVATVRQWDMDVLLLNTPAGVVDLRTGELRASRQDDYMSKIASVKPGGGCPTFLSFLHKITNGDREFVAYLRRVFGYCLTGQTNEDALFFIHGSGANGKSTLLRVIKTILGGYALASPSSVFTANKYQSHPTEIARMHGKRLVVSSEIEPGQTWAESRIKELTGGDEVSARLMRQDFFEFVPQMKLVIAGNHKPGLGDVSEAFRRRFHLLPFTVTVPLEERDANLEARLISEGGGILQWMIEGCAEWQKSGLQPPGVVTRATGEYLESQDRVAQWIDSECETKPGAEDLLITAARKHYNGWATSHNVEPLNRDQFKERIERLGYTVKEGRKGTSIRNLVLGKALDDPF